VVASAVFQPPFPRALSIFHPRSCYFSHFDSSPVKRCVANSKYICEVHRFVRNSCEQFFGSENARQTDHVANIPPEFLSRLQSVKPPPPPALNTNCATSAMIVDCICAQMFLQKIVDSPIPCPRPFSRFPPRILRKQYLCRALHLDFPNHP